MKVKKGNRILTIGEEEKSLYLNDGYDAVEFDEESSGYKVIESAVHGRTYSIAEYQEVVKENSELKEQIEKLKQSIAAIEEQNERDALISELKEKGIEFKENAAISTLRKLVKENA